MNIVVKLVQIRPVIKKYSYYIKIAACQKWDPLADLTLTLFYSVGLFNCRLYQNDILQFNPPQIEPTIDPTSICRDFPELNKRQISMCNRYPHATASAVQGR